MLNDLRYGFRMLFKSPGFTAVAVLTLALGIGANTAIFTLIDAVILRSLPVRSPDELFSVGDASRPTALWYGGPMLNIFSYPLYQRLREQNRVFTGLLASGKAGRIDMSVGDGPFEEVRGRLVSGNYFEVLGVSQVLGRTFSAKDDRTPGANPVIVISYDCWQNRFARDSSILGRALRLNGSTFTVIGVGPPHFTGEVVGSPTDIWIPLSMQAQVNPGDPRLDKRDSNWLLCMGRLKPGVSIQRARAEMTVLAQDALMDYEGAATSPDRLREIRTQTVDVQPGAKGFSWIRKHDSPLLFMLMVVVGLVLLIACANVATLLLVRASSRQKEISVRLAVGASRWRLICQLLTESALLAATSGAAGLLVASWGSRLSSRLASGGPNPIPFDVDVHPNVAVLAFTAAVSLVTAILFGLVPALRSTRVDLVPMLKETACSTGHGQWQLGELLVIGQLALSLPLLIVAGLFVRSLVNLETLDIGYSRANLVLLKADLAGSGYGPRQQLPLTRTLIERLRSVPGVLGVTVSENGLFSGTDSSTEGLQVEGFKPVRKEDSSCSFDQVGPHYFQVVGVQLLAGRDFDEHDNPGAPAVAIVNDTMARFYFGNSDPLGKYIVNGNDRYAIVGVVRDMKVRDLKGKTERRFYVPLFQEGGRIADFNFEIRTRDHAAPMVPAIRRELRLFDRNLKVPSLKPVHVLIHESLSEDRLTAQFSGFFGGLALLLAAIGLYGVMAFTVAQRTHEIGIRMALGAARSDVVGLVVKHGMFLTLLGVAIGLILAFGLTRVIASQLHEVSATDPTVFSVVSVLLAVVAFFACYIPARRATKVDPMVALRYE
jgi:predicted permease